MCSYHLSFSLSLSLLMSVTHVSYDHGYESFCFQFAHTSDNLYVNNLDIYGLDLSADEVKDVDSFLKGITSVISLKCFGLSFRVLDVVDGKQPVGIESMGGAGRLSHSFSLTVDHSTSVFDALRVMLEEEEGEVTDSPSPSKKRLRDDTSDEDDDDDKVRGSFLVCVCMFDPPSLYSHTHTHPPLVVLCSIRSRPLLWERKGKMEKRRKRSKRAK